MDAAIKILRILQFALLASIVVYVGLATVLSTSPGRPPAPIILIALTFLSVMNVVVILVMRRVFVSKAEEILRNNPEDAGALMRWRGGYIVTYAIAESVALYGLVLHFLGFTHVEVTPFFLAGFVLLVFFSPRRPARAG